MKLNLKTGLLAAVLAMVVNMPLSAQSPSMVGSPSYIGTNYTQLIAISNPVPGPACYLGYNSQFGNWESGTITSLGVNNVLPPGQSGFPGWSSMSSFNVGNNLFWVQYNSTNGKLQINQMQPNCGSINTVVDSKTQSGLSQIVALHWSDNTPFLMAYNSGGDVQLYTIGTDAFGIPTSVDLVSSYPFTAGYTVLMPYYMNGFPYFIAYNSNGNGPVEFDAISQTGPTQVFSSSWGSGWVDLVPKLTTLYFLGYDHSNPAGNPTGGVGALDLITGNNFTQNVQGVKWNTGLDTNYSLFAPFFFKNVDTSNPFLPGFISYREDGQVQVWMF